MWHQSPYSDHRMQHDTLCCPHIVLWAIGMLIGLGQLLMGPDELSRRRMVGRAIVSGGIASSAGAVLLWIPDMPSTALLGIAAGLASLGTSGIERLLDRIVTRRP